MADKTLKEKSTIDRIASRLSADKEYFRITEVSRMLNEPISVLRYWESQFKVLRIQRSGNSRVYTKRNLLVLREIHRLLRTERYSIAGAKRQLWLTKR